MSSQDFSNIASGLESVATILALLIGGYWTFTRFIKQRENYAFIEFAVDIEFIGQQGDFWIVELVAILENKGKVQHSFRKLSFDLALMNATDSVRPSDKYGGQTLFPHENRPTAWIPDGLYFIEPGVKAKYSYLTQIPAQATFVMLHGQFTYENQSAWHTAEKTRSVPKNTSNDCNQQTKP